MKHDLPSSYYMPPVGSPIFHVIFGLVPGRAWFSRGITKYTAKDVTSSMKWSLPHASRIATATAMGSGYQALASRFRSVPQVLGGGQCGLWIGGNSGWGYDFYKVWVNFTGDGGEGEVMPFGISNHMTN